MCQIRQRRRTRRFGGEQLSAARASGRSPFLGLTSARWAAIGVGLGLFLLLLWFAYQRGASDGGLRSAENARERRELLGRIAGLEDENGKLNAKIAELEMARRLDREAYGQIERTLGELQSGMSRQSDDLAFYKSIVSPADGIAGLRIQRFEIAPGTAPRQFLLRLTLIQAMRHDSSVAGLVQVALSGLEAERPRRYTVGELVGRPNAKLPFSFKYFQTIEQTIELPAAFKPYTVDVTVSARKLRAPMDRSFPWKTGPQTAL
jgi:hypothetical protein